MKLQPCFSKIALPVMDSRYKMKLDIIGAAALIHGYPALVGLGITLTKNQRVEAIPRTMKVILAAIFLFVFFHMPPNFSICFS